MKKFFTAIRIFARQCYIILINYWTDERKCTDLGRLRSRGRLSRGSLRQMKHSKTFRISFSHSNRNACGNIMFISPFYFDERVSLYTAGQQLLNRVSRMNAEIFPIPGRPFLLNNIVHNEIIFIVLYSCEKFFLVCRALLYT